MIEGGKGKQKILIVDDSEINRSILTDMLSDNFVILEALDGVEAVTVLQRYGNQIDLMLLDIIMPNMDGFGVLEAMNENHWIEDIPVIMISTERDPVYIEKAYEMGITDFITRPFDIFIVRRRVINTIMLYVKQKKLMALVENQVYEKERSNSLMVGILSHIVEFRNGESGLHVIHIQAVTEMLLRCLLNKTNRYGLRRSDISLISTASALHDIGKIAIPENILNKPGKLTDEEFETMKSHSMIGASMLNGLSFYQNEKMLRVAYEICRWHHERYDGRGYPDGLKGEEIPIAAQIVALADVYDALTSDRVYKKAYSHEKAIDMIERGECGVFNPILMECLAEIGDSLKKELGKEVTGNSRKGAREITEELLGNDEMTVSQRTLNLLEHERTKYQFLVSMSNDILFEYTKLPSMVTISESGAKRLGLKETTMDPFEDMRIHEILGKDNLEKLKKKIEETTLENPIIQYECSIAIGGVLIWVKCICCTMWTSEEPPQMVGVVGKIIENEGRESEFLDIEHMAAHDALTGLLNLSHAKKQIIERLINQPESEFALIIFDLDSFRSTNDKYGHLFGDNILKYVSERLKTSIRKEDIAARIGGDEFLLLVEYRKSIDAAVERIFSTLTGEYDGFPISISMGIAKTENTGRKFGILFAGAEQALSAAKWGDGGCYRFYDKTMRGMRSVLSSIDEIQNN